MERIVAAVRARGRYMVAYLRQRHTLKRSFLVATLCIMLFTGFAQFVGTVAAYAAAAAPPKPNKPDPKTGTSAVHHAPPAPKLPNFAPKKDLQPINNKHKPSMDPATIDLDPAKPAHFLGSDGRLEVDVPAGAITAGDVSAAKGKISLRITEVAPAGGSNAGGSGIVSFGSYFFEIIDGKGARQPHGLRQAMALKLHYGPKESAFDLSQVDVVYNGAHDRALTGLGPYHTAKATQDAKNHVLTTQLDADPTVVATGTATPKSTMSALTPLFTQVTPNTLITFNTYAPVAKFGAPSPLSVDLNSGSLTQGIKLDVPPGPAQAMPNLTLAYNSGTVSEQHSPQGTAGWAGEGWGMSLGSISWAEHNVLANTSNGTWQNSWYLNDPFGTSTEIIPPDINVSTYYDDTPNPITTSPVSWHTADETYAKIYSYKASFNFPYGTGGPSDQTARCFRVFLANGVMEEFGCTPDSLQYYPTPVGGIVGGVGNDGVYYPVNWMLDLITNPHGDQVHITYQSDTATGSHGLMYPRDLTMATVEWDSPTCFGNTAVSTMCTSGGGTGLKWQPLYRVNFAASHTPTRLTNTPTGCNTGTNLRCDDPLNLTGTGNMGAPLVNGTFVLNDIQVQTRTCPTTCGTWGNVHTYQLSYEQSGPTTMVDPVTGKNLSRAGMLDLTKVQLLGADNASTLPPTTFGYTTQTEYYEDSTFTPYVTTACGPSWNTGGNGGTCDLWSQSYEGNSRYLTTADNGQGLHQAFTWVNARNNTHGVNSGLGTDLPNPFYCSGHQTGYPCNSADDQAWSRMAVEERDDSVQRITQNGQGGTQTPTTVTGSYIYAYLLSYPLVAQQCTDCVAGMYWGNQNDGDYLDYYNGHFMGFTQGSLSKPDGSVEIHKFYATEGFGVYDTSQVAQASCQATTLPPQPPKAQITCHASPWFHIANVGRGHEYEAFYFGTDGTTVLKHTTATYTAVCPPNGVNPTPPYTGQWGNWDSNLVSELDHNNPVMVCDVQQTQTVAETKDGTSGSGMTLTTNNTYDNLGRITQQTMLSSSGSPNQVVSKTSYNWNNSVTANATGASGLNLLDFPTVQTVEDGSGNRSSCLYTGYDGQSTVPTIGQTTTLTRGLVTASNKYTSCGTSANGYTPSNLLTATATYDSFGNHTASKDPDANAGNASHTTTNCSNSTSCSTYDSATQAKATASTSLSLTSSTTYDPAKGGSGLFATSTTDPNMQTSAVTYDTFARLATLRYPSATQDDLAKTYTTWCTATGAQTPCVEVDKTQRLDASTTVTSRTFYDGASNLVETRTPAPGGQDVVQYTLYDTSNRAISASISYFVTAYTGAAGAAAFSIPDSTVSATSTMYDGVNRTLNTTDPLSHQIQMQYSVLCGVSGFSDSGCYEQTITTDANAHQHGMLVDGFGRLTYDQSYTGNSSGTYAVYGSTVYGHDASGHTVRTQLPTGAVATATYDGAGRETASTDPDLGAYTYAYDANGNMTQMSDPRGAAGTVYMSYDGYNRVVWKSVNSNGSSPFANYTYDCGGTCTGGNQGKGQLTHEGFTSGGVTGSYDYTFDGRGQQTGWTMTLGSNSYAFTMGYNEAGMPTNLTFPDTDSVTASYSSQGWPGGMTRTQSGTTTTLLSTLTYTGTGGAMGNPSSASVGNGIYTWQASYDGMTRPTESKMLLASNNSTLYDTLRTFDNVGNVSTINTTLPTGTDNQRFCYDEQNRLNWAGSIGTPPTGCGSLTTGSLATGNVRYTQSYTYDNDNRLRTGPMGTYYYSDAAHVHAVTAGSVGYGAIYDAAGDMTCRQVDFSTTCSGTPTGQKMSYDMLRRMTGWQNTQTSPTQTATYAYDGEGERVQQVVTSSGTTTTTNYLGNYEELSTTGGTTTTTKYYAAGVVKVTNVNGTLSYLASDGLGSVSAALSASGTVTATQLFLPYGGARYTYGSVMPTTYGFTGQRVDPSGLNYMHARYYDPVVGQFTSADTVQGDNRYAYVAGNPETNTDPTGHLLVCGGMSMADGVCWRNVYRTPSTSGSGGSGGGGTGGGGGGGGTGGGGSVPTIHGCSFTNDLCLRYQGEQATTVASIYNEENLVYAITTVIGLLLDASLLAVDKRGGFKWFSDIVGVAGDFLQGVTYILDWLQGNGVAVGGLIEVISRFSEFVNFLGSTLVGLSHIIWASWLANASAEAAKRSLADTNPFGMVVTLIIVAVESFIPSFQNFFSDIVTAASSVLDHIAQGFIGKIEADAAHVNNMTIDEYCKSYTCS